MFSKIVHFSIKKKLFVGLTTFFLFCAGIYAMLTLPIDAVPDITNNQVQIVTISPTLAPQEVEQLITFPIEVAMSNIMNVEEIRSVSRFGMSLVTVVFNDHVPTLDARQLINEQIQKVAGEIPPGLGSPELMPITTGLGEIYQYTLQVEPGYEDKFDAMTLRTIQDWIVKRQLSGIPGIVEINSFGGYLKQYEVGVDPDKIRALDITLDEIFEALNKNNQNTGASYIEKHHNAYYIRSSGLMNNLDDINNTVITTRDGAPILIRDVADVQFGNAKRFGAMTKDGKGECVGGIAMMLKGANANVVTADLEERVAELQSMLPEGVTLEPYLNRSALVTRNISTVVFNLVEGAIIVFLVLIIFLGNFRAGVIVASVIPLTMLFAFILMRLFNVSANLMSLGAIDFGIVVDGSIVIIEGILAHIYSSKFKGKTLTKEEMDKEVERGANKVVRSATFAVLIILIVFFPILTLTGIEGKYFTPMAQTLVFCIIGALLLSLTYVPMMSSLFLKHTIVSKPTIADKIFDKIQNVYMPTLSYCLRHKVMTLVLSFSALAGSLFLFGRLGAEFIPTLDEGDFAMQMTLPVGSSLSQSIELSTKAERVLLESFPEIKHVVSKIGTAEVPTDPMAVEDADIMIVMKPFKEWTSASSRAEMVEKMKERLAAVTGATFNFSQPIQLRFNELMTGSKADIAIKLYGEDMNVLYDKANEAASYISKVNGAADVIVEQVVGLPQLVVEFDRKRIAQHGLNIDELNAVIRTAFAGEAAGVIFENERRFDLVVRYVSNKANDVNLDKLFVRTPLGEQIPLSEVAKTKLVEGPLQINRDATKRRIVIGVNVRDADVQQVVAQIQEQLNNNVKLDAGYRFTYGGQFENLQNAISRLTIVIPVALSLILLLLFFAFGSITYALVIFSTVPLSLIGGITALWLRGLPFSISAGVGFIALFGVSVLNGILMINHFNQLKKETRLSTNLIIWKGCPHLLRPVMLTGLVASLGFVPMAIATSAGSEVQRPLATVVIGGLIVSTLLTLIIIPIFYRIVNSFEKQGFKKIKRFFVSSCVLLAFVLPMQAQTSNQQTVVTLDECIEMALQNNPMLKHADVEIDRVKAGRGAVVDLSPMEFDYAQGQLNSDDKKDRQYNLSQSLGSLITPIYKNKLVNRQIESAQIGRKLTEKELIAEVKSAWNELLYAFELERIYTEEASMAQKIRKSGEAKYRVGEITLLEKSISDALAADMQNKLFQSEQNRIIATNKLRAVCFSPVSLTPAGAQLELLSPLPALQAGETLQSQRIQSFINERKAEVSIEASKFFPELSLGYQNQNILPLKGLQSWSIGVSFPVYFLPQRSRIKQAKLQTTLAQLESQDIHNRLQNKLDELNLQQRKYGQTIENYQKYGLEQARALRNAAEAQLKHEENDISEFVQSIKAALELQVGYIDALYQYNESIIEYQLYQK